MFVAVAQAEEKQEEEVNCGVLKQIQIVLRYFISNLTITGQGWLWLG